jgi:hypothetical protein
MVRSHAGQWIVLLLVSCVILAPHREHDCEVFFGFTCFVVTPIRAVACAIASCCAEWFHFEPYVLPVTHFRFSMRSVLTLP